MNLKMSLSSLYDKVTAPSSAFSSPSLDYKISYMYS